MVPNFVKGRCDRERHAMWNKGSAHELVDILIHIKQRKKLTAAALTFGVI